MYNVTHGWYGIYACSVGTEIVQDIITLVNPSGSRGQQEALKPICQRLKLMHHVASPWQTKSVCVQLTHV